jgi:hypothetical protein
MEKAAVKANRPSGRVTILKIIRPILAMKDISGERNTIRKSAMMRIEEN